MIKTRDCKLLDNNNNEQIFKGINNTNNHAAIDTVHNNDKDY